MLAPNPITPGALADGHQPTDVGNADRFVAAADGRARYVHNWGRWMIYRGGRWVLDYGDTLVAELAKEVSARLRHLAVEVGAPDRDELWKHAKKTESATRISAMVRLARGVDGIV